LVSSGTQIRLLWIFGFWTILVRFFACETLFPTNLLFPVNWHFAIFDSPRSDGLLADGFGSIQSNRSQAAFDFEEWMFAHNKCGDELSFHSILFTNVT